MPDGLFRTIMFIGALPTIISGVKLIKKKDKTELEKRAAKSLIKVFAVTMTLIVGAIVASVVTIVSTSSLMPKDAKGYQLVGVVEGGNVRYEYEENNRFLPLDEFELGTYNLQQGDSVILFFHENKEDAPDYAMPQETYEDVEGEQSAKVCLVIFIVAGVIIAVAFAMKKGIGKDYAEYCQQVANERG